MQESIRAGLQPQTGPVFVSSLRVQRVKSK